MTSCGLIPPKTIAYLLNNHRRMARQLRLNIYLWLLEYTDIRLKRQRYRFPSSNPHYNLSHFVASSLG
jgi:hypothetical protein